LRTPGQIGSPVDRVEARGVGGQLDDGQPSPHAPVTATAHDATGHRLSTAQLGIMERVNLSPLRVSYWAWQTYGGPLFRKQGRYR
jgi:hypothetical protein